MPDIAKCSNDKYERKDTCYRYICKPNPYYQSYVAFNEKDCDAYWECKSESELRRLDVQNEGEL